MGIPVWLEVASAAGQAIGGIATAAAVVYGYMEFRSWKNRAQSTDRASAAAKLLAAFNPFCFTLQGWINRIELATHRATEPEGLRELDVAYREGLGAAEAWHRRVEAAEFFAHAYLTAQEREPIARAITVSYEIELEYSRLVEHVHRGGSVNELWAMAREKVVPLHPKICAIRAAGAAALQRIDRHEAPVPRGDAELPRSSQAGG